MATQVLAVSGDGEPAGIGDDDRRRLVDALAAAAGVDVVADAVGRSYRRRALAATGWPVTRWLAKLRPDPLRRLRLDREGVDPALVRTSLPATTPIQRARSDAAIRRLGDAAADGIGGQWTATIRSAAKAAAARLPDALDQAVAATNLRADRRPRWWSVANAVQWVAVIAAVVGGLWLLALAVVGYLRLPEVPTPEVGSVPVPTLLFLGGILLGVGLAVVCMFAARVGGSRRAAEVRQRPEVRRRGGRRGGGEAGHRGGRQISRVPPGGHRRAWLTPRPQAGGSVHRRPQPTSCSSCRAVRRGTVGAVHTALECAGGTR